jgi:DNA repair photolyase
MIISVSRRTDIPCHYSAWFFERLREGFAFSRNPMNTRQLRRVSLSPGDVDALVFWSKNPRPMLEKLSLLDGYPFYVQFTLNAYGRDIEPGLPPKSALVETFKKLSGAIGPHRVIWRYDPILLNDNYTVGRHIEQFALLARALRGYTEKVTISFIDIYPKIMKSMTEYRIEDMNANKNNDKEILAEELSALARTNGFTMDSCAESIDLSRYGISHGRCIDARLIERIGGRPVRAAKDRSQRPACGCAASVDIGAYNSCATGCVYCYANHSRHAVEANRKNHYPSSPLLIGGYAEAGSGGPQGRGDPLRVPVSPCEGYG